jgi:hypothetical protein
MDSLKLPFGPKQVNCVFFSGLVSSKRSGWVELQKLAGHIILSPPVLHGFRGFSETASVCCTKYEMLPNEPLETSSSVPFAEGNPALSCSWKFCEMANHLHVTTYREKASPRKRIGQPAERKTILRHDATRMKLSSLKQVSRKCQVLHEYTQGPYMYGKVEVNSIAAGELHQSFFFSLCW